MPCSCATPNMPYPSITNARQKAADIVQIPLMLLCLLLPPCRFDCSQVHLFQAALPVPVPSAPRLTYNCTSLLVLQPSIPHLHVADSAAKHSLTITAPHCWFCSQAFLIYSTACCWFCSQALLTCTYSLFLVQQPSIPHLQLIADCAAKHCSPNLHMQAAVPAVLCSNTMFTLQVLLSKGVEEGKILFLSLIAAPEGIHRICAAFPRVKVITSEIDEGIGADFQVIPGMQAVQSIHQCLSLDTFAKHSCLTLIIHTTC